MKKLLLVLLSVLTLMMLAGCESDPEGLAPPGEFSSVGQAYYTSAPLTLSQLNSGVRMYSGWNAFIWTDGISGSVSISDALNSVSRDHYYIYSYNERKYYFNPNERYAKYNSHSYYKNNLLQGLKPSHKYGLYMARAGTLKYGTSVSTGVKITMLNGSVINVTNTTIVQPNGTTIVPSNITIIQPNGSIVVPRNTTIIINNTVITPTTPVNNATPGNQTCTNECSSGQKGCSGTQVWQCRIGSDGCYDRVYYNCGTGYVCQNGVCTPTTNQTTPGNQTNSTY